MIKKIVLWLAKRYLGTPFYVSNDLAIILEDTKRLVLEQQSSAVGTSGEYKRHIVFSKLVKIFPKVNKQDLSLAIELVVRNDIHS